MPAMPPPLFGVLAVSIYHAWGEYGFFSLTEWLPSSFYMSTPRLELHWRRGR